MLIVSVLMKEMSRTSFIKLSLTDVLIACAQTVRSMQFCCFNQSSATKHAICSHEHQSKHDKICQLNNWWCFSMIEQPNIELIDYKLIKINKNSIFVDDAILLSANLPRVVMPYDHLPHLAPQKKLTIVIVMKM